jgi:hypothetical protein
LAANILLPEHGLGFAADILLPDPSIIIFPLSLSLSLSLSKFELILINNKKEEEEEKTLIYRN